jgi:hypothetical protein
MYGTRSIILAEKRNNVENNTEIEKKYENIAEITTEQQIIWNHNSRIIPLLIGNKVHLHL